MSIIRDAWLRKFATQLPLGIDIKDDDGNVIHKSIGNPTTHMITLYSAWLGKGSGGSTGGNTGTGDGGNTGGDTGGTTNPGHETVGDDVYPGDVNKGELTKRFKLWQGPSKPNEDTTVTFSQDLGENLDGLGDGLQAQLSMVETPYFDGKAQPSKTIPITNREAEINTYSTSLPLPISLKKGRLASKDILSVELKGEAEKKTLYTTTMQPIKTFKTQEDGTIGDKPYTEMGLGYTSFSSVSINQTWSNAAFINMIYQEKANRSGTRLAVYQNGKVISYGLYGSRRILITGLTPSTVYDNLTMKFESSNGTATSNTVSIKSFTTTSEPKETIAMPTIPVSKSYSATPSSNGVYFSFSQPAGHRYAIFDPNNKIVGVSSANGYDIVLDNLEPNTSFINYKWAVIYERESLEDDKRIYPKISFQMSDDGNMLLKSTKGQLTDASGNIVSTFDIIVNSINSYTVQDTIQQLAPDTYLFVGKSKEVQLANASKNFDNIGDGLEIVLYDPVDIYTNTRTSLSQMQMPKKIRVPKELILNGISNFNLLNILFPVSNPLQLSCGDTQVYHDNTWGSALNGDSGVPYGFEMSSNSISLTFQNGGVSLTGNIIIKLMTDYHTSTDDYSKSADLNIASIKTYKEGE